MVWLYCMNQDVLEQVLEVSGDKTWVLLDKTKSEELPGRIKLSALATKTSLHHGFVPCSALWVIPDLLIGFAADLQHLLALELQLFSQGADVLVECVDLVVELGDVVLPPGDFLLELSDPAQQLTLLGGNKKTLFN